VAEKLNVDERVNAMASEIPEIMKAFFGFHSEVVKDGALSAKMKELIMVGISVAIRCEHCITKHVSEAVRLGATRKEVLEAVGAAILMAGGPAVAYGSTVALDTLNELNV
jgi:AhpD family alkylhydroperoxidase